MLVPINLHYIHSFTLGTGNNRYKFESVDKVTPKKYGDARGGIAVLNTIGITLLLL